MPSRTRRIVLLMASALLIVVLTACGASDPPPPTSPLDDRQPEPTAPAGVETGTPPPLGGSADAENDVTPTPQPGNGLPDSAPPPGDPAPDEEAAAARAIELMADWLGIAASDLELVEVEAVEWVSACIGIERPDVACAEVITPGWRVELQTLLRATVHIVHVSESGRFAWAPERDVETTVVAVDRSRSAIEVATDAGTEHWLVVPGSDLDPAFADLDAGMRVIAGLDEAADGPAVVWLVAVPGE